MHQAALPEFPFRVAGHDRLAELRRDDARLAELWADPATRVVAMREQALAADDARGLRWTSTAEAPAGGRVLLGEAGGVVHFVVLVDDPASVPDDGFLDLRRLATTLDDTELSLAVHASAVGGWHLRHPRCSICGSPTDIVEAGASRQCPECGAVHFPRTDPAVIMLVFDDDDRCLLGHNAARAASWYSTLAGFVEPGEAPEQAVVREVFEETGVRVTDVTYLGSQPWPFPSSLMLGFFARALTTDITVDGEEITEARWFTRDELRDEVLAGDLVVPTTISIAGALLTRWYGGELPQPPSR